MKLHHAILSLAFAGLDFSPSLSHSSTTSIDDIDFSPKKQPPPKGTRLYKFDGFETVAISEKSAIKKYHKWLLSNSKTLKWQLTDLGFAKGGKVK